MSVSSHFVKNIPSLRMPKNPDGVDSSRIKWQGNVLQGNLSTREAVMLDRITSQIAFSPSSSPFLKREFDYPWPSRRG